MLKNLLSRLWSRRDPVPFHSDYLPAENGHQVFYHQFGNPHGEAILYFHGGPGSCSKPRHARPFDLRRYRLIFFDQRGGGRSKPTGELRHNTPVDLISDARRILDTLNLEKAHVAGGSWGTTLALLFAETFPERVCSLLLSQIFLARPRDVSWVSDESRRFYPDIVHVMRESVRAGETLRQHYAQEVLSDTPERQSEATRLYGNYEHMLGSLEPGFSSDAPSEEQITSFRLFMHMDSMDYGLAPNQLLENAGLITHLPSLIVHNRLDMVCPPEQAWELHQRLPRSRLVLVPNHGHSSPGLRKTFARETAAFLQNRASGTVGSASQASCCRPAPGCQRTSLRP